MWERHIQNLSNSKTLLNNDANSIFIKHSSYKAAIRKPKRCNQGQEKHIKTIMQHSTTDTWLYKRAKYSVFHPYIEKEKSKAKMIVLQWCGQFTAGRQEEAWPLAPVPETMLVFCTEIFSSVLQPPVIHNCWRVKCLY